MKHSLTLPLIALSIASLVGCASPRGPETASYPASYPAAQPAPHSYPASRQYGRVDSIQYRQANAGGGIGVGAVVGGLVGGVLGNQVGGGSGRKAATVAGVIGGAMVGNEIEKRNGELREEVVIGVRLDDGSYRSVVQDSAAGLQVGSRVRIEGERVYLYR